jgi:hypothetical protein
VRPCEQRNALVNGRVGWFPRRPSEIPLVRLAGVASPVRFGEFVTELSPRVPRRRETRLSRPGRYSRTGLHGAKSHCLSGEGPVRAGEFATKMAPDLAG